MLLFCLVGIISACLTIFINYCLGKPGSEKFSPYEIFSSYTVWLSKFRLKRTGILIDYEQQYKESSKFKPLDQFIQIKNDYKIMLYEAAEPYFTWERAVGMCPVCAGFWISLFTGIIYIAVYQNFWDYHNFFNLLIIIVISHVTIRILNKLL